ncbi:MAG: hypothetical protein A3J62_02365 [Candidatus Buchananbacteria bacterium RIFCSPHIGHO2_02_FULL_38_8]|uniref:Uncharacterized protein n=1 Tax=Candidatus Buchananbacteria bacterium RIFCSPHIGHO2_02_FULL_38_8 TaxID=1797538 RepID=A0A1G1Y5F1_9BACT|nr:MAG: hypothetical protein A3J62_02365 [Candidatus Buchananbacteria bacterium RIFCSPHIGHO2_02_FULL_38_8]
MPEEIQNIFDDVVELKKANPWLNSFALTDNEVKEIIKLISRIILGSVKLDNFFPELKKVVRKDEGLVKKLALTAITNRFLPLKEQLGDVEGLLTKLGGSMEAVSESIKTQPEINNQPVISFSPQDDEEIKKIISAVDVARPVYDYHSLAELIMAESGYDVKGDEVIFGRFKNIIVARLKDVRDELETTEALKKSRKIGGLDLTEEEAGRIISLIRDKIGQGLLDLTKEKPAEARKAIIFPAKKPFVRGKITLAAKKRESSVREERIGEELEETKINNLSKEQPEPVGVRATPEIMEEDGLPVIKLPPGGELLAKPRFVSQIINQFPQPLKSPAQPKFVTEPETNLPSPQPQPQIRPISPPKVMRYGKPSVDGVRVEPILVGPVEELGTMTLINFRRLGETPHQAIARIKEKVDLLEKDSYAKKLAGIEAWHKSEVNRFYRLLGQEGLRQGRSIDDIINERLQGNKPTLSVEEFNSVMELNRSLRY